MELHGLVCHVSDIGTLINTKVNCHENYWKLKLTQWQLGWPDRFFPHQPTSREEAWVLFHVSLPFAANGGPSGIFYVMIRMVSTESFNNLWCRSAGWVWAWFCLFYSKTWTRCLKMSLVLSFILLFIFTRTSNFWELEYMSHSWEWISWCLLWLKLWSYSPHFLRENSLKLVDSY